MSKKRKESNSEKVEWKDVGDEFKYALYNIGNAINRALDNHEKEGRKKKRK